MYVRITCSLVVEGSNVGKNGIEVNLVSKKCNFL